MPRRDWTVRTALCAERLPMTHKRHAREQRDYDYRRVLQLYGRYKYR